MAMLEIALGWKMDLARSSGASGLIVQYSTIATISDHEHVRAMYTGIRQAIANNGSSMDGGIVQRSGRIG